MIIKKYLNYIHLLLSKNSFAVVCALKIRNQFNLVIGKHLGQSSNMFINGEDILITKLFKQTKYCFENCVVFDVGANKGDYTEEILKLANLESVIYCFEPDPSLYQTLNIRFQLPNVRILNYAVSDQEGAMKFLLNRTSNQLNTLLTSENNYHSGNTIEVKVTTIDNVTKEFGIEKIYFLKIDVEGFDFHVIRGAQDLLETNKISIIQFEYGSEWARAGSTLFAAINFLEKYQFKIFRLTPEGLLNIEYQRWGEYYSYANYVAINKTLEKDNPIWSLIKP